MLGGRRGAAVSEEAALGACTGGGRRSARSAPRSRCWRALVADWPASKCEPRRGREGEHRGRRRRIGRDARVDGLSVVGEGAAIPDGRRRSTASASRPRRSAIAACAAERSLDSRTVPGLTAEQIAPSTARTRSPTCSRCRSSSRTRCGGSSRRASSGRSPSLGGLTPLIVCGMGGSAIGGDLADAALGVRLTKPLSTVRGYELPSWTTPRLGRAVRELLRQHRGDARLLRGRGRARRDARRGDDRRPAGRARARRTACR